MFVEMVDDDPVNIIGLFIYLYPIFCACRYIGADGR